jgi:hypothetical protein
VSLFDFGTIAVFVRHFLRSLLPALPKDFYVFFAYNEIIFCTGFFLGIASIPIISRFRNLSRKEMFFIGMCLFCFICSLLPVATLKSQIFSTEGERFVYIPTIFISIALSFASYKIFQSRRLWRCLAGLVISCYLYSLWETNTNWAYAAHMSESLVNQIAAVKTSDDLILLNIPDNYRGAYVFRNGLQEALRTFKKKKFHFVKAFVLHDVLNINDLISFRLDPPSSTFYIELRERNALIRHTGSSDINFSFEQENLNNARIQVKNNSLGSSIYYYDQGKILPLKGSSFDSG